MNLILQKLCYSSPPRRASFHHQHRWDSNLHRHGQRPYINDKVTQSVEVAHTGHDKSRFTTLISIVDDGTRLPSYIVFRKLTKAPNVNTTDNLEITANDSGFMDEIKMLDWVDRVLLPYTKGHLCLLVLDDYAAHKCSSVIGYFVANNIVPTSMLTTLCHFLSQVVTHGAFRHLM